MKRLPFYPNLLNNTSIFLLILLWTYAGASKLMMYQDFREALLDHGLIKTYASLLAWSVPLVELIIACLLFGRYKKAGLWLSLALLLLFTGYICYMILYDPNIPCSCGGVIGMLTWKQHILFNLDFMIFSLVGLFSIRRHQYNTQPA
jgi:hypothetical protein